MKDEGGINGGLRKEKSKGSIDTLCRCSQCVC